MFYSEATTEGKDPLIHDCTYVHRVLGQPFVLQMRFLQKAEGERNPLKANHVFLPPQQTNGAADVFVFSSSSSRRFESHQGSVSARVTGYRRLRGTVSKQCLSLSLFFFKKQKKKEKKKCSP